MKYISVIEDKMYLLWQQEVQIENFRELGLLDQLHVVVIYSGNSPSVKASTLKGPNLHFYPKPVQALQYSPANKPYGVYKFIEEFGTQEGLFLLDCDVLLAHTPSWGSNSGWVMSNCESYLGHSYLLSHLKDEAMAELCNLMEVSYEDYKDLYAGGGAQYLFDYITAEEARYVFEKCLPLYNHLKETGTKIQVWTAEMWCWLFAAVKFKKAITMPKSMDFCWATDKDTDWGGKKNILHLAGITSKESGHFYKGDYTRSEPWVKLNFDYITQRTSCSWSYFSKMKEYMGIQD